MAAEQVWFDFEAGVNTNISNAERSRDVVRDRFIVATANLGFSHMLDERSSLNFRVFGQGQKFSDVEKLRRISAGATATYNYSSGSDPMAWGLEAGIGYELADQPLRQRDSSFRTARLAFSKPLTLRITSVIGVEYTNRDSEGNVWDIRQLRGFLSGSYEFHPTWSASAAYSYIDGDVVSTAQVLSASGVQSADIFGLLAAADEIERDEAFSDALPGIWFAYRLPAYTNTFQYAIGKDLDDKVSVDLSVMDVDVSARGDNNYDSMIYRLGVQRRF